MHISWLKQINSKSDSRGDSESASVSIRAHTDTKCSLVLLKLIRITFVSDITLEH